MQPQILKVNDIEQAIRENGLEIYIDRLIQDAVGSYFYVEVRDYPEDSPGDAVWNDITVEREEFNDDCTEKVIREYNLQHKISPIPRDIAYFIIDTLKLQAQVRGIGAGDYSEGPHGGVLKYYVPGVDKPGQFKEISVDVVRVEEL